MQPQSNMSQRYSSWLVLHACMHSAFCNNYIKFGLTNLEGHDNASVSLLQKCWDEDDDGPVSEEEHFRRMIHSDQRVHLIAKSCLLRLVFLQLQLLLLPAPRAPDC